ncbi:transient receptor potential cation channel subfamily V member 1-like isoform X1 [Kryptolebias marmoratus]|uniref:Transient receptor potential cation channel subfamily V member 1-like n=1 Tax=Kryptolebias marmoratus TaxID=37003 RepID=A0A3Q2ZJM9_KRYMA|nr:transient receptor potential cation channel subfamily V member 1-like isoform X1 [Kryptolebias marmoratus]
MDKTDISEMDTIVPIGPMESPESQPPTIKPKTTNNIKEYTKDALFKAASEGYVSQLDGLLEFLQRNEKKLIDFRESDGKTVLTKALLNLKDGKNDTIEFFIDTVEKNEDLKEFINAPFNNETDAEGQTALHIAIERRNLEYVKLLVEKGADLNAKASGPFFQRHYEGGFYFGELPLSLAACTNQPEIVSFLMNNPKNKADATAQDSRGNTVLHALVIATDKETENMTENTENITKLYDYILTEHYKSEKSKKSEKNQQDELESVETSDCQTLLNSYSNKSESEKTEVSYLESIENNKGLTPLKLAAKLGRFGMLKHIMNREFPHEETKLLSRKFTEWSYGPVHCSLYDISSIDTIKTDSVLDIILFRSKKPNRPQMLQIEPLHSLLRDKWDYYAYIIFWIHFVFYLIYLAIFTSVAFHRKDGQPPFAVENTPSDIFHCIGQIISVLGAIWFLSKSIQNIKRNALYKKGLLINGFVELLFFLQASLLLVAVVLYFCGREEYVGLLVLSLALAWVNTLYYARGSKQLGIYNVMMQRMILGDLFQFLCIYSVLLFGFSAAVVTLMDDRLADKKNITTSTLIPDKCGKPSYSEFHFALVEMFKFTFGMGNLDFTDDVEYKEVFYILLVGYIVLTYILMLNMLIALMGNTVENTTEQSENIWYLQRAFAVLDMERSLPMQLRRKLNFSILKKDEDKEKDKNNKGKKKNEDKNKDPSFFRVIEKDWKKWKSGLRKQLKENPVKTVQKRNLHGIVKDFHRRLRNDQPDGNGNHNNKDGSLLEENIPK